ncbi:hypothetical protein CS542_03310 [Pedobacter sp. IW39]|nr:hypothetical protein CS542_03310 [Pedobacter sp. IW39]
MIPNAIFLEKAGRCENSGENTSDIFQPLKAAVKVFHSEIAYLANGSNIFKIDARHSQDLLV